MRVTRTPARIAMAAWACWLLLPSTGCKRPPQDLPVVVAASADSRRLEWRDAHGPLLGEVPWVLRTDVIGPDTFLVVATSSGDARAREVSFEVRAAGSTEYQVTLVSDLQGRVSWRVAYGDERRMKLFTCAPRPAVDALNGCLHGGIPKPLLGVLTGTFSAELADGRVTKDVRELRFERDASRDRRLPAGMPALKVAGAAGTVARAAPF